MADEELEQRVIEKPLLHATEEINPWSSSQHLDEPQTTMEPETRPVNAMSAHDLTLFENVFSTSKSEPLQEHDTSLLSEFDPLVADQVERDAREAWAGSAGHLPRLSTPSPPPPPSKDVADVPHPEISVLPSTPSSTGAPPDSEISDNEPTVLQSGLSGAHSAPAFISSFPSLASLARTLSLSPRRSVTPPLPLPPRSSSLRHSHHSSLPNNNITAPDTPPNALQEQSNSQATPPLRGANNSPKQDHQFDFQRFLDQMKTKGADPIAKYLRSFLSNFAKKTFAVNDQIKIIHDFLDFIANKMRTLDGSPWLDAPPQEFENAMEAMEKLVMNRLYEFTFQPLLPPSLRTTDDLERDHVLKQRILLFGWLREEHLDIPTGGMTQGKEVKGFLEFAQQELLKINHYKAPRDKLICILNCCKVIFGLIRHIKLSEGADSFIPILIFVVLKANPEHLLSNIEYISRFRRPNKLQSEAGYYLSSLMGAVSFIETMDHTSLSNISQEEFEGNVESAIEALPPTRTPSPPTTPLTPRTPTARGTPTKDVIISPLAGEEAARPLSLPMPSNVGENGESNASQVSLAEDTRRFFQRTSDTISKPLTAIGRIFSDVLDETGLSGAQSEREGGRMGWRDLPGPFAPLTVGNATEPTSQPPQTPTNDPMYQQPIHTPYKPRIRPTYSPSNTYLGSSPGIDYTPTTRGQPLTNQPLVLGPSYQNPQLPPSSPSHSQLQVNSAHPSRNPTPTLDFGAMQDEIDRAHLAAQDAARETLRQIFPTVDQEVAEMVLEANDGDLGQSIEGLLEITGGGVQPQ
ncbi:hypothetical protein BU17DRAFT_70987 [Hysterangium stoloniferum]|nr:hypothetical protein BU17DRAFT_70987 [Hysterangium stoloniferum]